MYLQEDNTAKIGELLEMAFKKVLEVHNKTMHKARFDFTQSLILALISSKSVQYQVLAEHLPGESQEESKVRRTSNYMNNFELDYGLVGYLLLLLLPKKSRVWLEIDRTEWDFGNCTHNMLTVTVYSHGVGVPIWFECVNPAGGCCDGDDKLYMLLMCLELLGKQRIRGLIGDSEFIGEEWLQYLITHKIPFFIDVRCNQYFEWNERRYQISAYMGLRRPRAILRNITMYGHQLSIGILRQKQPRNKKKKAFLAIITNQINATDILGVYRLRWGIEVFFQSIKERGFKIEGTHIDDPIVFRKLFALVCIAFTLSFVVGLEVNKIKPIRIGKDGYKQNSFFRVGLDFIRRATQGRTRMPHKDKIIQQITTYFVTIIQRYKPPNLNIILQK